jgi:hypothetical protein
MESYDCVGPLARPRSRRRPKKEQEYKEEKTMTDPTSPYGPGTDAVGLPTGNTTGGALPEGFDFGSIFGEVKDWLIDNNDKVIQVVVPWLKKTIAGQGFDAQAFDLPLDTPITALVQPSMVSRLSPSVKKLTKSDLLALGGWGVPRKLPSELGLTAKDIQTIRDVFTPQIKSAVGFDDEPDAWSISCCSCTPCCCAAAVTKPIHAVA